MGNCQALCAATLVIQHPNGKVERYYWPLMASEVMKMNPGHYVSLIIPLPVSEQVEHRKEKIVQYTRVKLLRPTDTLTLGHAYRLVTSQEVMKVLKAKKHGKMKKQQPVSGEKKQMAPENQSRSCEDKGMQEVEKGNQVLTADNVTTLQAARHERHRPRSSKAMAMRSKLWRPSLQSITEAAS